MYWKMEVTYFIDGDCSEEDMRAIARNELRVVEPDSGTLPAYVRVATMEVSETDENDKETSFFYEVN